MFGAEEEHHNQSEKQKSSDQFELESPSILDGNVPRNDGREVTCSEEQEVVKSNAPSSLVNLMVDNPIVTIPYLTRV